MSRRFRREEDYIRQIQQEAEEEEDKQKTRHQKYNAPIVWAQLTSGFAITDIVDRDYDEVLEMIKEHFIPNDVICRNTEIDEDPVSLKSFMEHILFTLKDTTSIKAVVIDDNEEETLAGILLLRTAKKKDFDRVFSRTILQEGEARRKGVTIQSAISRKIDIYSMFHCDIFLRYYLLCVKPEYRKKGLGLRLLRAGMQVARSLNIHVVSGIFNSFTLQRAAKRIGFKVIQEISYTNWRDKNNDLIFNDPGAGNYTCAFMVAVVPPQAEYDPLVIKKQSPKELQVPNPPKTRAEKRATLHQL